MQNIINKHFSKIKDLNQKKVEETAVLYAQIKNIEKEIDDEINKVEQDIQNMKNEYLDTAIEISIQSQKCPTSRWGSYLNPDMVDIDEDGISLTWTQSYDRDDYFHASWEDIATFKNNLIKG